MKYIYYFICGLINTICGLEQSLSGTLLSSGSILAIFGFFLLFNKMKYGIVANRILGVLLASFGLSIFFSGLGLIYSNTYLFWFSSTMGYAGAPLLYFYTQAYMRNHFRVNKKHMLHFIPFIVEIILLYHFVLKLDPTEQELYMTEMNNLLDFYRFQRKVVLLALFMFYIFLFIKDVRSYHRKALEEYSYTNNKTIRWFYLLIATFFSLPIFSTILPALGLVLENMHMSAMVFINVTIVIFIFFLRPEIYKGIGVIVPIKLSKLKYSFPEQDMTRLYAQLLQKMKEKKLFLNQNLHLSDVSDELNSNPNYVSQAINGVSKQSFFDFINTYRIDYAKKMLVDDSYSNYSIEGIGKESGFRSKSAFYNSFKKYCQMSPAKYKNKYAA